MLEDYRKWDKRNAKTSPLAFLGNLFKGWDIHPIDWSITKENDVLKLDKAQSIEMGVCNEAAIALAFAVLKMRASCPADVVNLANCALERTSILMEANRLIDKIKVEWDAGIKRMKLKLESSPR